MQDQHVDWDLALIQKYNYSGPRYTSYPTALEFNEQYDDAAFRQAIARYPERPLSLYVHIPFCHRLCYFCGCNKLVTRQQHKAEEYLDVLAVEIRQRAPLFAGRIVTQLHWGGGTPTYLNQDQISRLMALLRENFQFADEAEISLEVDPREIELDILDHLRAEGFNRLSMGVQDFNKEVQRLVNREQDEAFIFALIERAKALGFTSTNIDLIYGLPKQTPESFAFTLQRVAELSPHRLSVFNYAHLPTLFAAQRKIKDADLPSPAQKLEILRQTITTLTQSGYQFIGMDHFARPDDELALAQRAGKLHRNFQGYTTQGDTDLLGMGVSAISMIGDSYAQNEKVLKNYYEKVGEQGNALWRGLRLTHDDCIRRDVIKSLICNFRLDYATIEADYGIDCRLYFAEDLRLLAPLVQDGLAELHPTGIVVTPKGRLLIRNICMCFDSYLRAKVRTQQFSRVI
ncbi:oxygen-independent coproporphyrinogen III oxidase [Symbiopectobacterium purcellii]|uniref:Coproporphyrinogen-III oxidase n=1 Tax=Symbiopectobacterium purcellii TaxID=2871826 RepID=A0ABX9AP95_9ENTR|nr:oxygen-independent coproporphyrinogen III oxidase [Symbiopectobacterium purcellii]QZN95610.1 oxygen-independent coproporphyrinogen III oxidase [Symbiopectobacterium purcellii]